MNQSQQVDRAHGAVTAYVETIDVPPYDVAAVRARTSAIAPRRAMPRWVPAVAAACIVFVAFVIGSPTVRAQVEHMLQAFVLVGGRPVPVAVNDVTFDQARRDMPFAVVAPAAIPPGFSERIDELTPSSSRLDARLIFRYEGANGPGLTIVESSARQTAASQMRLWMTTGAGAPQSPPSLSGLSGLPPGEHAFVQFRRDGVVQQRVKIEPIVWTVRGTRVSVVSPPGLLSPMQLAAIRRAMSH